MAKASAYLTTSFLIPAQSSFPALTGQTYAVVGGGACLLLGHPRSTADIDIVVPAGAIPQTRRLLRDSSLFEVDPRTRHTFFADGQVQIELLAPPTMFREPFDSATPTVQVDGVKVLLPVRLLNAKCGSILQRAGDTKKASDAQDIRFLLRYVAEQNLAVRAEEVPNASREFVEWAVGFMGVAQDLWDAAGYNGGACEIDSVRCFS